MRPPTRRDDDEETDSLVSAHSLSDASFTTTHEALARERQAAAGKAADEDPGTPAATLTPRPLTATTDGSAASGQYFTTLEGDVIPPVPAIPADFHGQTPMPSGVLAAGVPERDSSHVDFAASANGPANGTSTYAPLNGGTVQKSRSVKSGVSRGRSGNRQHRGSEAKKPSVVDVDSLLGSVGLDDDDDDLSVGGEGLGKAPY